MNNPLSVLYKNKTVKDGALFAVFSFINQGISFILLIIIAKYINPDGYGRVNLFNTCVQLLGYFICLNTSGVISVNYFRQTRDDFNRSVKAVSNITCVVAVLLLVFVFILKGSIEKWTGLPLIYQIFSIVVAFSTVYTQMQLDLWRVEEKVKNYGVYSILFGLTNFILTIVMVVGLKLDWEGRIYANFILSSLFLFIGVFILIKRKFLTRTTPRKEDYRDCLKFGIPLIPHSMSSWIRQGLDRMYLNNFQSVETVGLFSFSSNFANIIVILGSAFNSSNSVYIFKTLASNTDESRKKLRKQTVMMILFFCAVSVIVAVGSSIFIPIAFPNYSASAPYIFFQCGSALCQCIYLLFVNVLFYYKKTRRLMNITFTVSLVHSLLSYVVSQYSVYYTLALGFLSSLAIMVLVIIYSRKIYKII